MPQKLHWTPPADAQLRRLRADGATWDSIAASLRLSRSAVIERGRRIGARRPSRIRLSIAERELSDPAREPLPPGHPISWGAITAGMQLAGMRYPWPPWERG